MIENTFCHINGVGKKTETRLWRAGICAWNDVSAAHELPVGPSAAAGIRSELAASEKSLQEGRIGYFSRRLPTDQQWRLFGTFRTRTAYLDIETTGLYRDSSRITTIALYDGTHIRCYVNGQNLHDFPDDISRYDLLVTYNGKSFDIPFIERFFNIRLSQAHIDLRHLLAGLGFKGGLKGCEKQMGIDRKELGGIDGYLAVLLWQEYEKTGSLSALETLMAYNAEDTVNLEYLMHTAYNLKVDQTPFAQTMALVRPDRPRIPFVAHSGLLHRIMEKSFAHGAHHRRRTDEPGT